MKCRMAMSIQHTSEKQSFLTSIPTPECAHVLEKTDRILFELSNDIYFVIYKTFLAIYDPLKSV